MCIYVVYDLYSVNKFQNWSYATCFQRLNGVIEYAGRSIANRPKPNGRFTDFSIYLQQTIHTKTQNIHYHLFIYSICLIKMHGYIQRVRLSKEIINNKTIFLYALGSGLENQYASMELFVNTYAEFPFGQLIRNIIIFVNKLTIYNNQLFQSNEIIFSILSL